MTKIKKAVIPAAGMGTRFFPATKTIPKEMLPIVDQPTILYVIEEVIEAGIEDVILIQGRGKTAIEDFFDISYELETKLIKDGKEDLLKKINFIRSNINFISVRQKDALGLGHAIHCSKSVIGNDPFAVLLGDEITLSKNKETNPTSFLSQKYESHGASAVWVVPVQKTETQKYGIIDLGSPSDLKAGALIKAVVEKPTPDLAPSTWALPGRYVFNSAIFKYIEQVKPGFNGEIQLSDAMNLLVQTEKMYAYDIPTRRFDAGDKLGYLIANVEIALDRSEFKDEFRKFLVDLIQKNR